MSHRRRRRAQRPTAPALPSSRRILNDVAQRHRRRRPPPRPLSRRESPPLRRLRSLRTVGGRSRPTVCGLSAQPLPPPLLLLPRSLGGLSAVLQAQESASSAKKSAPLLPHPHPLLLPSIPRDTNRSSVTSLLSPLRRRPRLPSSAGSRLSALSGEFSSRSKRYSTRGTLSSSLSSADLRLLRRRRRSDGEAAQRGDLATQTQRGATRRPKSLSCGGISASSPSLSSAESTASSAFRRR